jgi:HSP20 family protein
MTKEDVNIELKDNCLTISGHTKADQPSEEAIYILRELKRSKFSRSFTLHENLDAENTKASFENGVLSIKIPYVSPKERQSKVIEIN